MRDTAMVTQNSTLAGWLVFVLVCSALIAGTAHAEANDPPSRVARIAYLDGSVSFQPAGTQDWVTAPLNRPLSTGDTLWAADNSRAELQLDGSVMRLTNSSELGIVNLNDDVTQVQLSSGTLILRVRRLDDNETYEVDTPNLAFSVLRPGVYRLTVNSSGNATTIEVRDGQGEVTGAGAAYTVEAGSYDVFTGTDQLSAQAEPTQPPQDDFDAWSAARDGSWDGARSAQYVSPDVVGYEDLDGQGSWRTTPEYGAVWYPNGVAPGWAPYQAGHWSYIAPWGYTWVDDQPWGFAPFHYGRWIWGAGAWGWVPCPPRPRFGGTYVRPVYAPALVAWVGAGAGIAWFALGPREVYVPSYPVSANYVRNINVSNTTVNTTVINNVYNTTIVNHQTVNVTYINRGAPGAVIATTTAAFSTAQPVAKNLLKVDQNEIERAPPRAQAPAVVPTKQAVLGASRPASAKPPVALQTRPVVARTPPPAAAPSFERRQQAIKNNGGRPLSAEQVRQIAPATAARAAPIHLTAPSGAPVVLAKSPAKPGQPNTQAPITQHPAERPAPFTRMQISTPAPQAVHPQELPAPPKVVSPSVANTALDREQLQQQQQMRAQQDQERQRVQQQQQQEHERLAKEQADQARTQELERQHQQQTQQLQQQHIQEQQALQAQQQEQRQQQEQQQNQQQAQKRPSKPNDPHKPP
jgi:hypothetical protein